MTERSTMIRGALVGVALAAAGCGRPGSPAPAGTAASATPTSGPPEELVVMTHDSFAVSEDVLKAFEEQAHVKVRFLQGGDAGALVNKAVLTKERPMADVLYGVDNTFLSRALDEGIFEAYDSPRLRDIAGNFLLDDTNRALPVDFGDVCLNYDRARLAAEQVSPPKDLSALTDPQYRSLVVVEDPATSSPGLAFLLATVGRFGPEGYLDYWRALAENDVLVAPDWETAYYQDFTRAGGARPIVVSYASSPPFEMVGADPPPREPPTAAVTADRSCFRQVEFVGILAGTQHRAAAEAWVDFMLDRTFQEDVPMQMYVFPVNRHAQLPEEFVRYLEQPTLTAEVSLADIAAHREEWIAAWREVMLR